MRRIVEGEYADVNQDISRRTVLKSWYQIRTVHYSSTTRDSGLEPARDRLAYGLRKTWVFWWGWSHPWTWLTEMRNGRNARRSCVGISRPILLPAALDQIILTDSTNQMGRMTCSPAERFLHTSLCWIPLWSSVSSEGGLVQTRTTSVEISARHQAPLKPSSGAGKLSPGSPGRALG